MSKTVDTKELILNEAERLLQRRGYNGFSYKDIAGPLGIKNAAIHYHFPTKADLGVALIERYRDVLQRWSKDFMAHGGDALPQLEGYFEFLRSALNQFEMVCPIGIMGTDYHTIPDRMRESAISLVKEILAWLTRILEVGREDGTLSFKGRPEDRAIAIKSSLQGAAQLARMLGPEILERVIGEIRRDLGLS